MLKIEKGIKLHFCTVLEILPLLFTLFDSLGQQLKALLLQHVCTDYGIIFIALVAYLFSVSDSVVQSSGKLGPNTK